jgi:hypothetical protein
MANTKDSSVKSTKKKPHGIALPQLHLIFSRIQHTTIRNRSDSSRETWALLWKTKYDRREIVVLICLLSPEGHRHLKDYQETIDELKLEAKKAGCTSLTDTLDIVKIEGGYQDQALWWHQFFGNDQLSDINHKYQLVYFGLDSNGERKKYQFASKIRSDTEWSLILHLMNNCDSIEEIVRSGRVPENTSDDLLNVSPNYSTARTIIDDRIVKNNSERSKSSQRSSFFFPLSLWIEKFGSNNSITIVHLRNLNSMCLSSIAMVRCTQAFLALRNSSSSDRKKLSRNNSHYYKPNLIPSQTELSKERVARWNAFLSALFDMLLGFLVGAILLFVFYNQQSLVKAFGLYIKRRPFQYLEDHIAWLETFPAGFKLNVQLTHTMGYGIRTFLDRHKGFLIATIWDPRVFQDYLVPTLATIGALGGWTTFLAFLVDLWRLEIIHVTFLAICFRKLYQAELYLLSALFRLFRGKKRNALRQRTDSMKYDVMQLLVGTIAFCVCVFLWTTVMVYYTFFVICNLLMHLPLMGCSVLYLLSGSIPFGSLFFRFSSPHWFPKDLYIKINDEIKTSSKVRIQVCELESILESPASILSSRTKVPLKRLFNWYLVSFLEILYPRAGHKSHSFLPLTLLVDDANI